MSRIGRPCFHVPPLLVAPASICFLTQKLYKMEVRSLGHRAHSVTLLPKSPAMVSEDACSEHADPATAAWTKCFRNFQRSILRSWQEFTCSCAICFLMASARPARFLAAKGRPIIAMILAMLRITFLAGCDKQRSPGSPMILLSLGSWGSALEPLEP